MLLIVRLIYTLVNVYTWIIFAYCILSWIPMRSGIIADLESALAKLVDPFLNIFRKFIPPIGGMVDISPIVAFFVLQLLLRLVVAIF